MDAMSALIICVIAGIAMAGVFDGLKKLFTALSATSWFVQMRWTSFLISTLSWVLMGCLAYSDSTFTTANKKVSISLLAVLFALNCTAFVWFSVKICTSEPKQMSVKGPFVLPDNLLINMTLYLLYSAVPVLCIFTVPKTVAGALAFIMLVPIAAFFRLAVAPDSHIGLIHFVWGVSAAFYGSVSNKEEVENGWVAYVAAGVSVFLLLGFRCLDRFLAKRLNELINSN